MPIIILWKYSFNYPTTSFHLPQLTISPLYLLYSYDLSCKRTLLAQFIIQHTLVGHLDTLTIYIISKRRIFA